jgi:hypothetical protein
MLTKEILIAMRDEHRKNIKTEVNGSYHSGWSQGFVYALNYILDHWDEIYQAHRMESAIEDAKDHLYDYIENDDEYETVVNSGLPEVIAERFLDNHDCNVAENDQYESIIEDLLKN